MYFSVGLISHGAGGSPVQKLDFRNTSLHTCDGHTHLTGLIAFYAPSMSSTVALSIFVRAENKNPLPYVDTTSLEILGFS